MKEKTCKNCGQAVDKKAAVCTACGVKIKKPIFKKLWFWVVVIFVISGAVGMSKTADNTPAIESNTNYNDSENKGAATEQPSSEKNSPKISKAEFDALQTGMTYEEACSIIGGEGELSSQVDVAGYDTKLYIWEGEGSVGANANVTFQNNELMSKAQFGLK